MTGGTDKVTVGLGENVTCTITNTDDPPFLKLVKIVINDSGGNKTGGNWTLDANATSSDTDRDQSVAGDVDTFYKVFANATYNLTESFVEGYSTDGVWDCEDHNQNPVDSTNAMVQVALGQNVTCSITNDDDPAFLKIKKITTDESVNNLKFRFDFNINGTFMDFQDTASVHVDSGTHMGMTAPPYIEVPTGNLSVLEEDYTNWELIDSFCDVYALDEGFDELFDPSAPIHQDIPTTDLDLEASEIAVCTFVNDSPVQFGYFTGGGRVLTGSLTDPTTGEELRKVTHGFQLHCNSESGPNNLQVNWLGNKFHLEQLVAAVCVDDGSTNEPPPNPNPGKNKPTLDVYRGEGYGRYNGECGAYAEWVMDDNSEPGKEDHIVSLVIWDEFEGNVVLSLNPGESNTLDTSSAGTWKNPGPSSYPVQTDPWFNLKAGNHQWVPHPTHMHGPTHTTPCDPIDPQSQNNVSIELIETDNDGDGIQNWFETENYGTDPNNADTDGGGEEDGEEISNGRDPLNSDDDVPPLP
jgi:hypothetical protein